MPSWILIVESNPEAPMTPSLVTPPLLAQTFEVDSRNSAASTTNRVDCTQEGSWQRAFGAFLVRADIIPVECALSQGFERAVGAFLVQTDKNPAECMRVSAHSAGFVARTSCSNVAAAYATSTLPWRPTRSVISARRTMLRASIRQGSSMRMTSPDAASTRSSTWSRPG